MLYVNIQLFLHWTKKKAYRKCLQPPLTSIRCPHGIELFATSPFASSVLKTSRKRIVNRFIRTM